MATSGKTDEVLVSSLKGIPGSRVAHPRPRALNALLSNSKTVVVLPSICRQQADRPRIPNLHQLDRLLAETSSGCILAECV
jgi:hypothetical protein